MSRKKWGLTITVFLITILGSISVFFYNLELSNDEQIIIAFVNGEAIHKKDIENLYQQLDGDYSRANVLNDLIDELVVVTYAPKAGVIITDEQVRSDLQEYQESLPDIYESGIEIYGEDDFYTGHKMQLIYNEVYEIVIDQLLQQDQEKYVDSFYSSMMDDQSTSTETEEKSRFIEENEEQFYGFVFDNWIKERRREAEIKVLSNKEEYNEIKENLCIVVTNTNMYI